jgi:hypothetical protein
LMNKDFALANIGIGLFIKKSQFIFFISIKKKTYIRQIFYNIYSLRTCKNSFWLE